MTQFSQILAKNKGFEKTQQVAPPFFRELKTFQVRAVEMRYQGHTCKEIAELLAQELGHPAKHQTVRSWFMTGGSLEKAYGVFAQIQNDSAQRRMKAETAKLVSEIPVLINGILDRRKANGERILDRLTLQAVKLLIEKLDLRFDEDEEATDPIDTYFTRLENELANKKEAA